MNKGHSDKLYDFCFILILKKNFAIKFKKGDQARAHTRHWHPVNRFSEWAHLLVLISYVWVSSL